MSQPVGESSEGSTRQHIMENTYGSCPIADVKVNNKTMRSLLDTGAEVSTIAECFYHQHLKENN